MSLTSKVGRSLKNQLRFKDLNAFTPGGTSNLNARKALYDAESQKPKGLHSSKAIKLEKRILIVHSRATQVSHRRTPNCCQG